MPNSKNPIHQPPKSAQFKAFLHNLKACQTWNNLVSSSESNDPKDKVGHDSKYLPSYNIFPDLISGNYFILLKLKKFILFTFWRTPAPSQNSQKYFPSWPILQIFVAGLKTSIFLPHYTPQDYSIHAFSRLSTFVFLQTHPKTKPIGWEEVKPSAQHSNKKLV